MSTFVIEIEMSPSMMEQTLPVLAARFGLDLDGMAQVDALNAVSQHVANEVSATVRQEIADAAGRAAVEAKLAELSD